MEKEKTIKTLTNKKIVLGNGFDLFCGLETTYKDFFDSRKYIFEEIAQWENKFIDLEKYLCKKVQNYKELSPRELNNDVTIWDFLFYHTSNIEDKKWCDIEQIMLESFTSNNSIIRWERVYHFVNSCENISFCTHEDKLLGAYCRIKNNEINMNIEEFYSFLMKELNKFEWNFGKYVSDNHKQKYNNYLINAFKFLKSVNNDSLESIVSIDTFNYTDNSEMSNFKKYKILKNIRHINGNFHDPIFGIDSTSVLPGSNEFLFTKTARRILTNTAFNEYDKTFNENPFDHLIVFGHSLNMQDYNYFFPIFDYLKLFDSSSYSKLIFCYNIYDLSKSNNILSEQIKNISKLLAAYDEYATGNKESRLMDSLSSQGRLLLYEIMK